MLRTIVALTLVRITASAALAKDLCIQLDSGLYAGSQLVLKKARVTRRSTAPLQGYLARYSFSSLMPLYGQSVVNTAGLMAFGISFQNAYVGPGSAGDSSGSPHWISMTCFPGTDGTINRLDVCNPRVDGTVTDAHVVDCGPETSIP
jgi:hypothetical protein